MAGMKYEMLCGLVLVCASTALGGCDREAEARPTHEQPPAASVAAPVDRSQDIEAAISKLKETKHASNEEGAREIVKIGTAAVPALKAYLTERDVEAAAAPKDKQWDLYYGYNEGAGACQAIGDDCRPVLQGLCTDAVEKGSRMVACGCSRPSGHCNWCGKRK